MKAAFPEYAGKHVVVTGCRSGIGQAAARMLTAAGARVHGIDWREPELPLATFTRTDLRDPSAIDSAVSELEGPVDALFNCAGLAPMHPWQDVMRVNFIGMRHLVEAVEPMMSQGGAIVTVGSNGGARWRQRLAELLAFVRTGSFDDGMAWCEANPAPQQNAYGFSKEAIAVWTMLHSANSVRRGVRLNCTSPGSVQTPMLDEIEQVVSSAAIDVVSQPVGRRSTPEEQAWVLLMLNSSNASYINGVDLPVDGGFIASRVVAEG
jgi:NAD(P)-dependent dehydrogenase (short-subunit alcohol dehydrogenase family)